MSEEDFIAPGSPLTPQKVLELGMIQSFPDSLGFSAEQDYTSSYRIVLYFGQYGGSAPKANRDTGFVTIRKSSAGDSEVKLKIHQEILLEAKGRYAGRHTFKAELICNTDPLSSLKSWVWESSFVKDGKHDSFLDTSESGSVEAGVVRRCYDNKTFEAKIEGPLVAEWSLFHSLQKGEALPDEKFTYFDSLMHFKSGHYFIVPDNIAERWPFADKSGSCVVQKGEGLVPYEYWLDENGRLNLVTGVNKVFILSDEAEAAIERLEKRGRIYVGKEAFTF